MSDLDDKLLLELADESRREFLKKIGKGLAMATSGIKPDLSAVKKVDYLSKPVIGHAPYDRDFDSYDAISYALDNMFEFGRAESNLSMPLKSTTTDLVVSYSIFDYWPQIRYAVTRWT